MTEDNFDRIGAETTTGCLLAANALGKRDKSPSDIGRQATEELLKDLSYEACVDRYLEDQVNDFIWYISIDLICAIVNTSNGSC